MSRKRIDKLVHERGLTDSREAARRSILAGKVKAGGHVVDKPGTQVAEDVEIEVAQPPRYVGRGGLKLERALEEFALPVDGAVCLDIGSSTGGFTDCLLQHGAAKVHAVDVGTNQLAWKIRSDPRVAVQENFNARYLKEEDLGEHVDLAVIDVSFISLRLILPPAFGVLKPDGGIVCLIKPQFELTRELVGKGGIVRDPALHAQAVDTIRRFVVEDLRKHWHNVIDSPITGADGNREFLAWLKH